jgi:hypothetical protein
MSCFSLHSGASERGHAVSPDMLNVPPPAAPAQAGVFGREQMAVRTSCTKREFAMRKKGRVGCDQPCDRDVHECADK